MAITDDRSPTRNYPLPVASNKLKDDVLRLRAALAAADGDVTALLTALALKADAAHSHAIADITGLQAELDARPTAFALALDDLTDVSTAGAANGQALVRQGAAWIPVSLQINNVSGLETALAGKATPADITTALNALVAAAPGTLDTLDELAAALGDDPNFATTIVTTLGLNTQILNATDATVADSDHFGFRRFSDGIAIKRTWSQLVASVFAKLGAQINGGTSKSTVIDADLIALADSAAANATKKVSFLELWTNYFKAKADALYLLTANVATSAQYLAKTASKILVADKVWDANIPVNLGATLTGNLTLDLATFLKAYGTATGAIVFNAVSNAKNQDGTIRITASGADRTVGFNTAAYATPNNKALATIASGTTRLYSYSYDSVLGKVMLVDLGTVS